MRNKEHRDKAERERDSQHVVIVDLWRRPYVSVAVAMYYGLRTNY